MSPAYLNFKLLPQDVTTKIFNIYPVSKMLRYSCVSKDFYKYISRLVQESLKRFHRVDFEHLKSKITKLTSEQLECTLKKQGTHHHKCLILAVHLSSKRVLWSAPNDFDIKMKLKKFDLFLYHRNEFLKNAHAYLVLHPCYESLVNRLKDRISILTKTWSQNLLINDLNPVLFEQNHIIELFEPLDGYREQFYLGYTLYHGIGCSADTFRGTEIIKTAAKQGLDMAQSTYGFSYHSTSKPNDIKKLAKAKKWYLKAAAQNHSNAFVHLYKFDKEDSTYDYRIEMLKIGARLNNPFAQRFLGIYYRIQEKNECSPRALSLLLASASQGDGEAAYCIGKQFYHKEDANSKLIGIQWLWRAALKANSHAQYELSNILMEQDQEDLPQALYFYESAAKQGHPGALYILGKMYTKGSTVEENKEKAFSYYLKAAEAGNIEAMYMTGLCYEKGSGVVRDPKEAEKWLKKGASLGSNNAKRLLLLTQSLEYRFIAKGSQLR